MKSKTFIPNNADVKGSSAFNLILDIICSVFFNYMNLNIYEFPIFFSSKGLFETPNKSVLLEAH